MTGIEVTREAIKIKNLTDIPTDVLLALDTASNDSHCRGRTDSSSLRCVLVGVMRVF